MEKALNKYIGTKIRELRTEKQLTQEAFVKTLVDQTGVAYSTSSISNIENGNQAIYLVDLYRICETFQKEIDYFLPPLSQLKELVPSIEKQIAKLPSEEEKSIATQLLDELEKKKGG